MSRFLTLAGLALRELWISFRLLVVVGVLLLAGLPVALLPHSVAPALPDAPPDPLTWFALALSAALALIAGVAAATLASERRRGVAGWMAVRAVPRQTIVLAWFAAFGLLLALGLVPSGLVAWFALETVLPGGAWPLVAATLAVGCTGLASLAVGLLAGSLLPAWPAAVLSALTVAGLLLAATTGRLDAWGLPAGGLEVMATLDTAARPVADALRAAGAALGAAAVVLVLAVVAFERAEL